MSGLSISPSNPFKNTRSIARGRGHRGSPSAATSHAKTQSSRHPGSFSPPHTPKLPAASYAEGKQHLQITSTSLPVSKNIAEISDNSVDSDFHSLSSAPEAVSQSLEGMGSHSNESTIPRVSDNTGSGTESAGNTTVTRREGDSTEEKVPPPPFDESKWGRALEQLREMATHTCQELKGIGLKLGKLDKIELATGAMSQQLTGVVQRTTTLEGVSKQNSEAITELREEIKSLRSTIAAQEETISDLRQVRNEVVAIKDDFTNTSREKVQEFSNLIGIQQQQVDSFHDTNKKIQDVIQDNVTQHVNAEMGKMSQKFDYKSLKDQASRNINNLVIIGLDEEGVEEDKSPLTSARDFVSKTLGIKNVRIDMAQRLGPAPQEGSAYVRPVLIRFPFIADRFKVWKQRTPITSEDGSRTIRIHQDLPKQLREDSQILHRVLKAASSHPKYKFAKIRDYQIRVNGRHYSPNQLERLPKPLRPSTLATRTSDSTLVFFTRHSILSNHHPAPFTYNEVHYANMEHYLAHQRALLSKDNDMIQRALDASDPLEAKSVLNMLKRENIQEWDEKVEKILIRGLREKFRQNNHMLQYLGDTQHLLLGEASRDPKWGIGMSLEDKDVLDSNKWLPTGNLLGRSLSRVRSEFLQEAASFAALTSSDPTEHRASTSTSSATDPKAASKVSNPQEKVLTEKCAKTTKSTPKEQSASKPPTQPKNSVSTGEKETSQEKDNKSAENQERNKSSRSKSSESTATGQKQSETHLNSSKKPDNSLPNKSSRSKNPEPTTAGLKKVTNKDGQVAADSSSQRGKKTIDTSKTTGNTQQGKAPSRTNNHKDSRK